MKNIKRKKDWGLGFRVLSEVPMIEVLAGYYVIEIWYEIRK